MKHPNHEEWMSYLYGESTPEERDRLSGHLHGCRECAAKVGGWQAIGNSLNRLQGGSKSGTPRKTPPRLSLARVRPILQWAAAVAILVAVGFGAGRVSSGTADADQIRVEMRKEFAQWLQGELDKTSARTLLHARTQAEALLAGYVEDAEARRILDNRAVASALTKLSSQQQADYLALKKDLDTVALNTDAGLRQTVQHMISLAAYDSAQDSQSVP